MQLLSVSSRSFVVVVPYRLCDWCSASHVQILRQLQGIRDNMYGECDYCVEASDEIFELRFIMDTKKSAGPPPLNFSSSPSPSFIAIIIFTVLKKNVL